MYYVIWVNHRMSFYVTGGDFKFSDSVTVYPRRINNDGVDYPVHEHFHKRSVSDSWHDNVEYKLKFENRDIKLNLVSQNEIVESGIVVQHLRGNHTWLEEREAEKGLSCFYEGSINGTEGSRVVLSLCDGMVCI